MPHARSHARKQTPKRVLALPDLEHAKSEMLSSLTSQSGQRTYDYTIRQFVAWCCSEPRLAFNRSVVLRYRIYLEQRQYAPATINLRLGCKQKLRCAVNDRIGIEPNAPHDPVPQGRMADPSAPGDYSGSIGYGRLGFGLLSQSRYEVTNPQFDHKPTNRQTNGNT